MLIKTYNAIVTAYKAQLSDYESKLASQAIQNAFSDIGNNPLINEKIVREELKKLTLEAFTGQKFEAFMAMKTNQPNMGYPEFDLGRAIAEGNYIAFFEKAIEWENMTWELMPYFWGKKPEWVNKMRYLGNQTDPEFTNFLRAGAARVMIPVKPNMTKAVLSYLDSGGEIWLGEDVPLVKDEYRDLMFEMGNVEEDYTVDEVGSPWIIKMPTSLVTLPTSYDSETGDPIYGLPDYEDRFDPEDLAGIDYYG